MARVFRPYRARGILPTKRHTAVDRTLGSEQTADQGGPVPARRDLVGTSYEEDAMSVYKVIEVIGTSTTSWEDAAAQAVRTAGETLHDLRVAEVVKQDIHLDESGGITFRTKLQLSFKYEHEHEH